MSNSVVQWNGSDRPTTFISGSLLTAAIPASDISAATTAAITIANPVPGGGVSNPAYFHVAQPVANVSFTAQPATSFPVPDPSLLGIVDTAAVGDFNGDGVLDLVTEQSVVSAAYDREIDISLGNGDGTFKAPKQIAGLQYNSVRIATGDFNNDGKLDLVVANYFPMEDQSSVTLYLGNGDGTFSATPLSGIGRTSTNSVSDVAVGDFNRDGKLDLAWSNDSGFSISLGNGDGTFQTETSYAGLAGYASELRTTDFNADGNLDIVLTYAGGNTIATFQGNGDGTFQPAQSVIVSNPVYQTTIADLNGDGTPDLLVSTENSTIQFFALLGKGDGTFQAPTSIYAPGTCNTSSSQCVGPTFAVDDFSGNGFADVLTTSIITTTGFQPPALIIGKGDGTFDSALYPTFAFGTYSGIPSPNPYLIIQGDFNDDGHPDFLGWIQDSSGTKNPVVFLQGAMPIASLSPLSLSFAAQTLNTTSSAEVITLTNAGSATLSVSSISASTSFAQTNDCPATLAVNASCTINVTFTPAAPGNTSGTLTITDNAPGSPQTAPLSGSTPATPIASFSLSSLSFGSQFVGTSSLPQNITVTNTGNAPLTIANVTSTTADFAATNGCSGSLSPSDSCSIGVFFGPKASGNKTGQLVITSNGYGSPQNIALSGSGEDFTITAASGNATISAGQSATYALSIAPLGGFNQTVSFSCSGAPAQSTCSISPTSMQLDGTSSSTVTVSVKTTAAVVGNQTTANLPSGAGFGYMAWLYAMIMFILFAAFVRIRKRTTALAISSISIVCVALTILGCGGGTNNNGSNNSLGTSAGTYALTITATSPVGGSTLKHTATLSLVVH